MNHCLEPNDLAELSRSDLTESKARILEIPEALCAPFNAEAGRLELHLLTAYKLTVLCVKKEENLDKVVKWWECMKGTCDDFLAQIRLLQEAHPYCGADFYYDRVFEVRAKCQRMIELHK